MELNILSKLKGDTSVENEAFTVGVDVSENDAMLGISVVYRNGDSYKVLGTKVIAISEIPKNSTLKQVISEFLYYSGCDGCKTILTENGIEQLNLTKEEFFAAGNYRDYIDGITKPVSDDECKKPSSCEESFKPHNGIELGKDKRRKAGKAYKSMYGGR
jgi:hypothetical protein